MCLSNPDCGRPGCERRRELFREARSHLVSNLAEDVSLERLAAEICASPRQLQRAFAENAGTGFRATVSAIRMERAANRLAADRAPVAVIGRSVGYRGVGAFSKAFRHHFGMAPSEFRARAGDSGESCPHAPIGAPAVPPGAPRVPEADQHRHPIGRTK